MALTLRDKQIGTRHGDMCASELTCSLLASIKRILNLNAPITDVDAQNDANEVVETVAGGAIWKVLVFDEMGRDVISSVLRVNDLRTSGVLAHPLEMQRAMLSEILGHNTSEHWNNAPHDP
jgi:hypothetical protein